MAKSSEKVREDFIADHMAWVSNMIGTIMKDMVENVMSTVACDIRLLISAVTQRTQQLLDDDDIKEVIKKRLLKELEDQK